MRATVRRIDLTKGPVGVEKWPTLGWMDQGHPAADRSTGPHGRRGLWDAMAKAVARAREVSLAGGVDLVDADVRDFGATAPHLAYLARVASTGGAGDPLPGADVIAMVDRRARLAH